LRQSGAILVNDPIALFETALLLECASQPISGGVAVAMQSGGNCTLFADALEVAGIPLRDFSPATTDRLAEILPAFSEPRNPLDVTGQAIFDHEIYRKSISALADDPQVGVVVIDVAPSRRDPDGSLATEILKHAGEVQSSTRKPVISVLATPLSYPGRTKAPLAQHSLTVLHGHAASAQAIAGLMSTTKPRRRSAERRIDRPNLIIQAGLLDETEAAAIFAAYGIERPREFVATSPDGVSDLVEQLGGCVVVKLICATIPHKAREGLVKLELDTPADARIAAQQIVERARELGVDSSRLLVQEQLPKGPEFLCGVTVDELYGPALTVRQGGGGVTGESKFHLLPLASGEAAEISAAAASEVSDRLSEPDQRALTEVVDRFSWLGVDLADRLLEIEANPIIVNNGRAVAVDALAVARDESGVK
jgi:acyl-CoA synthetase (NDP forming)